MNEQENVKVAQQAYENFKNGRIQELLNLLADDVSWKLAEIEGLPFSGAREGREAVGQFFAMVNEYEEPLTFEPQEFIAQGDKVVALGHYVWRVRANGKEYESDWAHVFTVRNGKVVSFQQYMDTAAAAKAFAAQ